MTNLGEHLLVTPILIVIHEPNPEGKKWKKGKKKGPRQRQTNQSRRMSFQEYTWGPPLSFETTGKQLHRRPPVQTINLSSNEKGRGS
jgi:hypothetical protein